MAKREKHKRIKLIVNPAAGRSGGAKSHLNAVSANLEAHGFKVDVEWAKPKEKATPLARQAAGDGYGLVVAMGGDGTVEAVMRGLIGSKVLLGIVPTGVQNNIARSLGIPLELEQACHLIAGQHTRPMDVGEVKHGKGNWLPFFEMVGIGYTAPDPLDETRDGKPKDALFRAQIEPSPGQQELHPRVIMNLDDNRILEMETRLVTITNTPIFGKKFIVPPPEFLQEGLLDISVFQGYVEDDLHGHYSRMRLEGYAGDGNARHFQSRTLKLRSQPPMDVIVDGMDLGRGTVSLRMRQGALHVIAAPESRDVLGLPRRAYEKPSTPETALSVYRSELNS